MIYEVVLGEPARRGRIAMAREEALAGPLRGRVRGARGSHPTFRGLTEAAANPLRQELEVFLAAYLPDAELALKRVWGLRHASGGDDPTDVEFVLGYLRPIKEIKDSGADPDLLAKSVADAARHFTGDVAAYLAAVYKGKKASAARKGRQRRPGGERFAASSPL
jgi:hypothetical protein